MSHDNSLYVSQIVRSELSRRGYLYTVDTHQAGPGLNCPLTSDPSGVFIRREGHAGQFTVGQVPDGSDVPLNIHGDVHPDHWEHQILPVLKDRFEGLVESSQYQ